MQEALLVTDGMDKIWGYDNIAIIVLMVCLLLSLGMNLMLVRGLLKMKDAFNKLIVTINTLNERIGHK
jgi:hypothetical protein